MLMTAIVFGVVVAAAICDARTGCIPDRVSIGGFLVLCGVACVSHGIGAAMTGAATASGALGSLYALTRGRGLGLGDVKLALAIGAAFGPFIGLVALGLAFVLGAIVAVLLLVSRRVKRGDEIYFAPYLAAGTFLAAFVHSEGLI